MRNPRVSFSPVDEFDDEKLPSTTRLTHNKPLLLGVASAEGSMFCDILFPREDPGRSTWYDFNVCSLILLIPLTIIVNDKI